ncbi:MAG: amidohydrolase family protein [Deltaproteobacteria bacterium]|nr:amidohydrolase family protein [Deltaproteobacteria bacterium]
MRPVLIDSHCHVMPDQLALAIRRFFDQHMGWGKLAYDGVRLGDIVRAQHDAGTERFWALPYAHKAGVAAQLNEWIAGAVKPIPGVVAAATFHPDDADLAAMVERAFGDFGLKLAKLHCSVGRFDADDQRLEPLWTAAEARAIPVVVHAGREVSGRTYAHELQAIARIAAAHPRLRLVIAHAGLPDIDAALDLLECHEQLHADLTSAAEWLPPLPVERIERLSERILFGSDCPNTTVTIAESRAWLRRQGLSAPALRAILGENAARLVP